MASRASGKRNASESCCTEAKAVERGLGKDLKAQTSEELNS